MFLSGEPGIHNHRPRVMNSGLAGQKPPPEWQLQALALVSGH